MTFIDRIQCLTCEIMFMTRSDPDSEQNEDGTPPSSRPTSGRRRKPKTKNGKVAIDFTPPDQLLKQAEKKSKRYLKEKKVRTLGIL